MWYRDFAVVGLLFYSFGADATTPVLEIYDDPGESSFIQETIVTSNMIVDCVPSFFKRLGVQFLLWYTTLTNTIKNQVNSWKLGWYAKKKTSIFTVCPKPKSKPKKH